MQEKTIYENLTKKGKSKSLQMQEAINLGKNYEQKTTARLGNNNRLETNRQKRDEK